MKRDFKGKEAPEWQSEGAGRQRRHSPQLGLGDEREGEDLGVRG